MNCMRDKVVMDENEKEGRRERDVGVGGNMIMG